MIQYAAAVVASRDVTAYWIARLNRAMTAGVGLVACLHHAPRSGVAAHCLAARHQSPPADSAPSAPASRSRSAPRADGRSRHPAAAAMLFHLPPAIAAHARE